jgi:hypothetical protein
MMGPRAAPSGSHDRDGHPGVPDPAPSAQQYLREARSSIETARRRAFSFQWRLIEKLRRTRPQAVAASTGMSASRS